mmetsp:Transcript_82425/g.265813  ORF Transcript_82425/g.265813 Transcript_82425/m.265813 type:complete len:217 (+) Transcript_82425:798-1448(+)
MRSSVRKLGSRHSCSKTPARSNTATAKLEGCSQKMCAIKPVRSEGTNDSSTMRSKRRYSMQNRKWWATCNGNKCLPTSACWPLPAVAAKGEYSNLSMPAVRPSWCADPDNEWCRSRSLATVAGQMVRLPCIAGSSEHNNCSTLQRGKPKNTVCPRRSKPRRPARPASCWNCMESKKIESPTNTLVFEGMLIPTAKVEVEMTIPKRRRRKRRSTHSR